MPPKIDARPTLKPNERVMSATALPRVPKGTKGTVTMVSGLTWMRYWVRFDNGQRIGTLHRDKLINNDDLAARKNPGTAAAVATGGDNSGTAAESVGGVPGYLLERSKAARARLAAKG